MKADNVPSIIHLQAQNVNGLAHLYWESLQNVSGVTGYNVLRRNKGVGDFVKLNAYTISASHNFFTDSTVKMGNVYEYKVNTEVISGKTTSPSAPVEFDLSYPAPLAPSAFSLAKTETGVELSWDLTHAEILKEVNIYRVERGAKSATKLGAVKPDANTYTDLTTEMGKSYFYYLTSMGNDGKESEQSSAKFITIE